MTGYPTSLTRDRVAGTAVWQPSLGDTVRGHGETVSPGHVPHDDRFESLLTGVGGQWMCLCQFRMIQFFRRRVSRANRMWASLYIRFRAFQA
jgi:hypothetical protein